MIKVVCGNNVEKGTVLVDPNTTSPKQVLDEVSARYGIDFSRGSIFMNGGIMDRDELELTFNDLGITNEQYEADNRKVYLTNVAKADNA